MYFEIECDKSKALTELFHKERFSLSPRSGDNNSMSWCCHNNCFENCFVDEQGRIITRSNNAKEFQRLHKLYLRGKCQLGSGFVLTEHMVSLIAKQAFFCDVIFRYFEERMEINNRVNITIDDITSNQPFVFQFEIDYCVHQMSK